MSRRRFCAAALAIIAHTAFMLALLGADATDPRWVPAQILATVGTLAVVWWAVLGGKRRAYMTVE